MVRAYYDSEPKRISYMPLPDGRADIRLCVNIEFVDDEDGGRWECDEQYFRAEMTREYVVRHFDELLDYVPPEPEEEPTTEDLLLEMAADHEMRICLIEMGVI